MIKFRTIQCASYCFLHMMTSNSDIHSSLLLEDGDGQEERFGGKKRQNNDIEPQVNVSFAFITLF